MELGSGVWWGWDAEGEHRLSGENKHFQRKMPVLFF